MDDLKKDQTKGKAKSPAQGSSIKQTEPDTKSVIPNPVNQPQASVVTDPGKATVDATNSAAAAKISLPDSKDFIPAPKNVVPETAKGTLGNDASQVKDVVPSAQNTKEVPKRDSEANWSFSTVAQSPQDTATVDNADLLELSRQLGTPTRWSLGRCTRGLPIQGNQWNLPLDAAVIKVEMDDLKIYHGFHWVSISGIFIDCLNAFVSIIGQLRLRNSDHTLTSSRHLKQVHQKINLFCRENLESNWICNILF